ncbi:MAG: acyl-ACP desaturase [Vicinamibacterales bacterium]
MSPSPLEQVHRELANERTSTPHVELLSPAARAAAIERGILALYRWYTAHSQRHRNWHPDTCIDWRLLRPDLPEAVHTIVEGFFAVEQYTPDYTAPLLRLIRKNYGRAQWHMRWGAEEEKHADLWRNTVLSLGRRTERWVEDYTALLREREWSLPWDSPRHMVFYQVIQERATQVSYLNLGLAAAGRLPRLPGADDPALAHVCQLITTDEAAHYHFFGEMARLLLYYDPAASVEAFWEVLKHFTMPARDLVPGYDDFGQTLHATGVFGRSIHYRDVVQVALAALSLPAVRALEDGVRAARCIPAGDGHRRTAAFLDVLDTPEIERKVRTLFDRSARHVAAAGLRGDGDAWSPAWIHGAGNGTPRDPAFDR